jgi:hypothetical protein
MGNMSFNGINTHGSIGITRQLPHAYGTNADTGAIINIHTKEGKAFMETLRRTEGMGTAYKTIMGQESKADGIFTVKTRDANDGLHISFGNEKGLKGLNIIAWNPTAPTGSDFTFQFLHQDGSVTAEVNQEFYPSPADLKHPSLKNHKDETLPPSLNQPGNIVP